MAVQQIFPLPKLTPCH